MTQKRTHIVYSTDFEFDPDREFLASECIASTRAWARRLHGTQKDKLNKPYLTHLDAVARNVLSIVKPDHPDLVELVKIAYLHDTLEDTGAKLSDLEDEGFSEFVIDAVLAISKGKAEQNPDYIARVLKTPRAAVVKLADLKHNTQADRMAKLPLQTRERLLKKYHTAIFRIENDPQVRQYLREDYQPTITLEMALAAHNVKLGADPGKQVQEDWKSATVGSLITGDTFRFVGKSGNESQEYTLTKKETNSKGGTTSGLMTLTFKGGVVQFAKSTTKVVYKPKPYTPTTDAARYLGFGSWAELTEKFPEALGSVKVS